MSDTPVDPLGRDPEAGGFGRAPQQVSPFDPFGLGVPMPTGTSLFDEVPWRPGMRMVLDEQTGELKEYRGPGIVRSDGTLERDQFGNAMLEYDLANAPTQLYFNLPPAELETILDELKSKGARVDTPEQAQGALRDLLTYSNIIGRDYETTLRELDRIQPDVAEKAPRYRVSSSKDLREIFDEAAKAKIGRGFTEEEMNRAIGGYQAGEMGVQAAESGVVESMASPTAYAGDFAMTEVPDEAMAFSFLDRMNYTMQKATRRVV